MRSIRAVASLLALTLAAPVLAEPVSYAIDGEHSFANWTIRHVVAKTSGTFTGVTGTIVLDRDNLANSQVEATIDVMTLNSGHRARDLHTLSAEFLDALEHETMRFESTAVEPTGDDEGILKGRLTLHGATQPVELVFRLLGTGPDPWGGERAGFEAHTTIQRSDYGIDWGLDMPGGGPLGDDVAVTLLIEGIRSGPDGEPYTVDGGNNGQP